jgi:hypothetical protein
VNYLSPFHTPTFKGKFVLTYAGQVRSGQVRVILLLTISQSLSPS